MKNKFLSIALICSLFFCSCGQGNKDGKQHMDITQTGSSDSVKTSIIRDSLEDLADKMRDEAKQPDEKSSVVVELDGWTADKNLNTIRRVTLTNTSSRKVVGVKLVYVLPMGKSNENRDLGKFKIRLTPSNTVVLKIPAKRFGVSDDIIEVDATTRMIFPDDNVVASVIYFENGDVETHDFRLGFQNKE